MNNRDSREFTPLRTGAYILGLASFGLMLSACSGDTGNSESPTANENTYTSDPESTGTIKIDLNSDTVGVAESSGYFVEVRKGDGSPLSNIRVACDTERGLALIEPTTGIEATDSYGNMSGRLGCEAPGSFQIGCRLPIGANKRVFKTVKCEGNIPEGFTGFEGAGGGGLYGGVATPPNGAPGGVGTDGLTVSTVYFDDGGESPTANIDTIGNGDCNADGVADDPEPFTDTYVEFKLRNDSNQSVRVSAYSYTIPSIGFQSREIALAGGTDGPIEVAGSGDETTLRGFFASFGQVSKNLLGSGSPALTTAVGFRNINFTIFGENESGDDFELEVTAGANITNYDRCEG